MRANWKLIATLTAIIVVVALFGVRVKHSFAPQAPASLNYAQHSSPGFTFNGDLRRAWKNVETLLTAARREEKATLLRFADLSFVHICKLPNDTLVWDTIEARNPGFESMQRFERAEPGPPAKLIGYYTLAGHPLNYDTKTDLLRKTQTLTTVELDAPIAAGKSVLFFRVQRLAGRITTNTPGKCVMALGRLPATPSTVNALGIALPKPAQLDKYLPDNGLVAPGDESTVVTWLSSRTDTADRHVQVTFTIPK